MSKRIAFIGGGNMAYALAAGLGSDWPGRIAIADPAPAQRERFAPPIVTTDDNVAAARDADIVVLAVKPQVVGGVAREIAPALATGQLIVSVVAGVRMDSLEAWFGADAPIVRCVPNTPSLIGAGITAVVANAAATAAHRQVATTILEAGGEVVWLQGDAALDAATALSGSGPAYFFRLIEVLTEAGVELGLSAETARQLTVATVAGAAAMARLDDPAALRKRVTSPGGTTERALAILAEREVPEAFTAAAHGAVARCRELAEEFGRP